LKGVYKFDDLQVEVRGEAIFVAALEIRLWYKCRHIFVCRSIPEPDIPFAFCVG